MSRAAIRSMLARVGSVFRENTDRFLEEVSGVVHVGANAGQERAIYAKHDLRVIWVEPIPDVFETLCQNIRRFPKQRAVRYLVTDRDDAEYQFHIANNNGESSSILDFKLHNEIWPSVAYTGTITLRGLTLASLYERERIDPSEYQALVLDTQGSELLVLKGSVPLLRSFKYIKTEVADFEAYAGCCQLEDLGSFMLQHEFVELTRTKFASRAGGGSYFNIVYRSRRSMSNDG